MISASGGDFFVETRGLLFWGISEKISKMFSLKNERRISRRTRRSPDGERSRRVGRDPRANRCADRVSTGQTRSSASRRKRCKTFDDHLAKVLKTLTVPQIDFVAFLIDHEVPSLTILAMISIVSDAAGKVIFPELEKNCPSTIGMKNFQRKLQNVCRCGGD